MQLTRDNLSLVKPQPGLLIPDAGLMRLPEKVLQFGTGVLLRGLPDYFIAQANQKGFFNGHIVMVKSTGGNSDAFDDQQGLYTLCVRGIENGEEITENIIISSVSRVIDAIYNWGEVLTCACDPNIELVISNTTEVGITFVEESIHDTPPSSFPGKLLAALYARYKAFDGDVKKGWVIIPTELISDNGSKLKHIIRQLAAYNQLEESFVSWLDTANEFCNSLVDRIVPGKLPATHEKEIQLQLGYDDRLMIMAEEYRLWAIECHTNKAKQLLSFGNADEGMMIVDDITKHKELKLRLLNASHTLTCALALGLGFTTVKEAMTDPGFNSFITELMLEEIVPALAYVHISQQEATAFAIKVLDRYRNPFLEHKWESIALQYTSKMQMRAIPLMQWFIKVTGRLPEKMARGFAAYLLFMRTKKHDDSYVTTMNGRSISISDNYAALLNEKWNSSLSNEGLVADALNDTQLWDLDNKKELTDLISQQLSKFQQQLILA